MKLAVGAAVVSLFACEMASAVTPIVAGDIGVAAPTAGIMAAPDGRWLVLCQARSDTDGDGTLSIQYDIHMTHGDEVTPYLVLGSGAGETIDYPAAHSPDGAWLAVVVGGKLELIETATLHRTVLDADVRNDGEWMRNKNARFVDVADNASRLVYIRRDNAIVIRELASGHERVVPMTELVWRATIEPTATWAAVTTIPADTDRDGTIAWPGGPTKHSLAECDADALHHYEPQPKDAVKRRWLELATGAFVDDPTVIGTIGGQLLHRTADDSLVLGTQRITEPACHATVEGTIDNPSAPRAIVACGGPRETRAPAETALVVVGPNVHVVTRATTYSSRYDMVAPHERFERIDDHTYVDYADGSEITLPGKHVAGYLSRFILIDGPSGLATFDLEKRVAIPLGTHGTVDPNSLGDQVAIDGTLYDLRTGKNLGRADDNIAFVATTDRVLRYAKLSKPGYAPLGPLRWDP